MRKEGRESFARAEKIWKARQIFNSDSGWGKEAKSSFLHVCFIK